jgi:zinc transporter ZupT
MGMRTLTEKQLLIVKSKRWLFLAVTFLAGSAVIIVGCFMDYTAGKSDVMSFLFGVTAGTCLLAGIQMLRDRRSAKAAASCRDA